MRDLDSVVRVVVGDDHPIFREGIVRALAQSGSVEVVAEAGDGRAALTAIQQHRPDVALLDYRMPGLDGVDVSHAVLRDGLPTRVLLLSAFTDSAIVYQALQQGVAGYLTKEADRRAIVDAVLACARGENVLPPDLATGLVAEIRRRASDDAPVLTARENQVLVLIAEGKSVPAMAKELFLAPTTVKSHLQRLYDKLSVSDRGAAVAEAMRRGLLE